MYRYSRGQSGQGSLPRPAWGSSGSHGGARASSPEPGAPPGAGGAHAGSGGDRADRERGGEPPKERQDEVILELQNELRELSNVCALKDHRIAELSRTDTSAARLKRDIRQLAAELHNTRKQLSEMQKKLQQSESSSSTAALAGATSGAAIAGASADVAPAGDSPSQANAAAASKGGTSPSASASAAAELRAHLQKISDLTEENKTLRETVNQLMQSRQNGISPTSASGAVEGGGFDASLQHNGRQPSGASTQRASDGQMVQAGMVSVNVASGRPSEPPPPPATTYAGAAAPRAPYLAGSSAANSAATAVGGQAAIPLTPMEDDRVQQIVYSSANHGAAVTLGPVALQGVGTVDGVSSVAKVLLQQVQSSVLAVHRRPAGGPMGVPGMQP